MSTVTISLLSSTSLPSSAHTASEGDLVVATMPSRESAIQSPSCTLVPSTTASRTAWVISPVRTRSRAEFIVASFSSSSALGSYSTSAARASGTLVVATTTTRLSVSASTCLATAMMFLLFGSTTTDAAEHASTASRICAVDGFID